MSGFIIFISIIILCVLIIKKLNNTFKNGSYEENKQVYQQTYIPYNSNNEIESYNYNKTNNEIKTQCNETQHNNNIMKNANFIAIDFETAVVSSKMPCQIGLVVVKSGEIVEKFSRYIQPPGNRYSQKCIDIHHITPSITERAPIFPEVWNDIKEYFEGNFIVAHNISFDLDVLYKALSYYGINPPRIMGYNCTYQIFGKKLNVCADKYGITLNNHHDALSDAETCCKLFIGYLSGKFNPNINEIEINNNQEKTEDKHENYHDKIDSDLLKQDLENADKSSPFYNKKVVITGIFEKFGRNELAKILKSKGADINTAISKKTNIVVVGDDPGPAKLQKANDLIEEGYDILIIDERKLRIMLQ